MKTSSVLLVCMLVVTCSVWTAQGRRIEVNIDDREQEDVETSVEAKKLPGVCWACQWVLKKVKKVIGPNATAESITSKLLPVCDKIGLLKSLCRKFVKSHLSVLVEELTTTDDVKTICINTGACKSKELMDQFFFSGDEDAQIIINKYV
ncbi:antimicrobial peptide NK-lysin-like [Anabas testudineus]|uniref:Saposin B-type domain-containing protein n=1 Tax=Anabas testudineus TaxID=64144 RepID=A0A3Q1IAV5_ANATE|nr:antimicrobial peptide NK-lysin-like [Anabas testudineus]